MRTLAVLSVVLLLAFLTHAEYFGENAEEEPEAQVHDMAISFLGERALREATGPQRRMACTCRFGRCLRGERQRGICLSFPARLRCCR
nr:neutrophil defensin 6-like [Dasypus novemcinctus]